MTAAAALRVLLLALLPVPAWAQIDYRNLDHDRPTRTEDAYAIERYAFELVVPYELEREGGASTHVLAPELSYGVARNAQLGIEWPLAALDGPGTTRWGLAGPRASLLYNFNTEGPSLPGLGVRGTLIAPLGELGPDDPLLVVAGLGTRSWGKTRLHVNVTAALGSETSAAAADAPRWSVSAAVDRTLLRRSILLLGELWVADGLDATEVTARAGSRIQLTPTLVLDAGLARRLGGDAGPDVGVTVGLSHSFGVTWLMPAGRR